MQCFIFNIGYHSGPSGLGVSCINWRWYSSDCKNTILDENLSRLNDQPTIGDASAVLASIKDTETDSTEENINGLFDFFEINEKRFTNNKIDATNKKIYLRKTNNI